LPSADRIFQAPADNAESVADRNLHGIVPSASAWIVIDVDIGGACYGMPDTEPVWIA
jgi:hypothetical protein